MNRGQALLFVLFLLMIIGIFSGTLTVLWHSEINTRSLERDGLFSFYMAQAGVERAKIWARYFWNPGVWPSSPYDSGWIPFSGGWYRLMLRRWNSL